MFDFATISDIFNKAKEMRKCLELAIEYIKAKNDKLYQEYHECRVVGMGIDLIIGYLLCIDALKSDRKKIVAHIFVAKALSRCKNVLDYILSDDHSILEFHETIIEG